MALNVLIVDDSLVTRMVLKKSIGMTDVGVAQIHEAADGREGLDLLESQTIDLIFADLNMPDMNGFEMIQQLRGDARFQSLPIFIISTESSTTRVRQLKEMGNIYFAHKPFTPETIRANLLDLLQYTNAIE